MKRSLLNKWIERLEDPNTKQCQGALKKTDGSMCCLGVLCDVVDPSRWNKNKDNIENFLYKYQYSKNAAYVPIALVTQIGMNSSSGDFLVRKKKNSLANLNDEGKTFKQIVKYIRKHEKQLFNVIEEDV